MQPQKLFNNLFIIHFCLCGPFIFVKPVNLSVFIMLRSHVRCLLMAEKLLSRSQDVTGSANAIFRSTKIFGKWSSSHSLIAVFGTSSYLFIHKVISWSIMSELIKSASYMSMTGASFVTRSNSLHINSGTRYGTLDALIENLL